jgi:hypothetical protein
MPPIDSSYWVAVFLASGIYYNKNPPKKQERNMKKRRVLFQKTVKMESPEPPFKVDMIVFDILITISKCPQAFTFICS